MGAVRKTETCILNEIAPSSPSKATGTAYARNLKKSQLGGVIFGCKNSTIKECLFKQLFGLPGQHFPYVRHISPGLPLFLFNYSDRKLYGIFEAASSGQMNINPYAWTADGSERTLYPAQVQIHVRLHCQPLREDQLKPIIMDNYYNHHHFWFELDHAQASRLISVLSSQAVAANTFVPQNTSKWTNILQGLPSATREEHKGFVHRASEAESDHSDGSKGSVGTSDVKQPSDAYLSNQVSEMDEKDLIYLKLKELALNCEFSGSPPTERLDDTDVYRDLGRQDSVESERVSEEKFEKIEETPFNSSDYPSTIEQLVRGMEELKVFKTEQIQKTCYLEQKLVEAENEIQQLKDRCMMLEFLPNHSVAHSVEDVIGSFNELYMDFEELILLVGGYDGVSWLSSLHAYSPLKDVITSLKPMDSVRSYASVAKLKGELYVFGGGNGSMWYETVESYNPESNLWTLRPPLNEKKGSLAGATLNDKIFALGGGNGIECFSNVEMLDLDVGRWIPTRSMVERRFALAAAELNGAIYAVGGFDGKDYLKSAERFDPREHSWARIQSMNTMRGCHSLIVFNEKLYSLGGFDGSAMVPSIEIFDPRVGTWMTGEPMNQRRGYSSAAVVKEHIYVIGGVKSGEDIVNLVECYKDGQGWEETNLRAVGSRCFSSAIVLGHG